MNQTKPGHNNRRSAQTPKPFLLTLRAAKTLALCAAASLTATVALSDSYTYVQDTAFPISQDFTFQDVSWVELTPDGRQLYVLQRAAAPVSVWDLDGNLLSYWTTDALGFPHSLKFQETETGLEIWITDMAGELLAGNGYGHCVKRFNEAGAYLGNIGLCAEDSAGTGLNPVQFDKVTDVTPGDNGTIWITDGDLDGLNNRVLQVDVGSQTVLQDWSAPNNQSGSGEGEFDLPHNIIKDNCDRVFVADALNNRVQILSTGGAFLQELKCFGDDGVYGIDLQLHSEDAGASLFVSSSPTSNARGGTVSAYPVSMQCDAPLPVPASCEATISVPVNLPQGISAELVHNITVTPDAGSFYISPLGGNLKPQRWLKVEHVND